MNVPFLNKVEHKKYIKALKSNIFHGPFLKSGARFQERKEDEDDIEFGLPFGNNVLLYVIEQLDYYKLHRFTHKIPLFLIKILEILWYSVEPRVLPRLMSTEIRMNLKRIMGSRIRKKYGEERVPQIIKSLTIASMRYFARYMLESLFVYPAMLHVKGFWDKHVSLKVQDEKLYKHARRRGAIILSGHIDFFLVYTWFGRDHYAVNVMDLDSMAAFVPYIRKGGCILVPNPRGDKSARDRKIRALIEEHIKKKSIMCLLIDAGYPYFPLVPFFGDYCRTAAGAAMLALMYNKKVAMMWVETDPKRKHHTIVIGKEIKLIQDFSLSRRELIFKNTLFLNQVLEKHVRKHITRWAFLSVYHKNKIFHETTKFLPDNPKQALIERLKFYEYMIRMSYEENRDDKSYRELLENALNELEQLS